MSNFGQVGEQPLSSGEENNIETMSYEEIVSRADAVEQNIKNVEEVIRAEEKKKAELKKELLDLLEQAWRNSETVENLLIRADGADQADFDLRIEGLTIKDEQSGEVRVRENNEFFLLQGETPSRRLAPGVGFEIVDVNNGSEVFTPTAIKATPNGKYLLKKGDGSLYKLELTTRKL